MSMYWIVPQADKGSRVGVALARDGDSDIES